MTRERIITTTIEPLPAPVTLVGYCTGRFTYFVEDQWLKEISCGKCSIDGLTATDPARLVKGGEILAWDGGAIIEPEVDDGISILHQDEWLIAVNKTGNLPVHPAGRYFHHTLTAVLADRYRCSVYPVHRIDRETSGIVLLTFDGTSAGLMAGALSRGTKEYLALVHGCFPAEEKVVDWPLGRDTASAVGKKRRAWPGGTEKARTRFRGILTCGDISLVRCFPETGRLHQIRAHLQSAGFPIVGDKLYGRDEAAFLEFIRDGLTAGLAERLMLPRQALHAARMVFLHPQTGKKMVLCAPLPKMFVDFIRTRRAVFHQEG